MVHLVARVTDPYGRLRPAGPAPLAVGLFVEAEIAGRALPDVVVLPRSAIREGDRVWVVDDESRLRFRSVEIVRAEVDTVVVGAGLEAGERVCVSPLAIPVDGMQVRVSG